jgi:type I restriction enzyme, S subunit
MKLETFFEKFDIFADAPDAVAKMRELVLELAVRGKLLSAHSPDSPVESDPASPFAIPQDWQWIALNKAADCRATAKVDSASLKDSDWVLDLEDIDGGAGKVIATLTFAERRSLSTKASFQKGDVLYGKLRPYLNKVVIADRPGFCTTEIIPLRPQKFVAAGYLRLFLRSPHFLRYAAAKNYGMKMPRLGTKDLKSAMVPLPPLTEQKRIVAKVDELMALCDRLEEQQKEREEKHAALARASLARFADAPTPANLNFLFHKSYAITPADLRKTILTLAVQGKLVPQDPNDEPAEVLLARLISRDAQTSGRRKRPQPDLAFTADEMPFELPPGWAWERLGNIGETNIGLTYSPQNVSDVGIPVLRSSNVQNGKLDFKDLVRVNCEPKQSAMVQDGDLLICARNGSRALVGKVAVIKGLTEPAAFGAFMAIFRSEVNEYLYHFIRSPLFRQMIDEVNTTTINQITQGNLRSTLAPIPPLAEQRRIVAKVAELMALVDELETQLAASRAAGEKLLAALVAELTAGALGQSPVFA